MGSTTLQTDDGDILVDFSKNLINQEVLAMLLAMVTRTHAVLKLQLSRLIKPKPQCRQRRGFCF